MENVPTPLRKLIRQPQSIGVIVERGHNSLRLPEIDWLPPPRRPALLLSEFAVSDFVFRAAERYTGRSSACPATPAASR